jgi:hypothetical protein
MKRRGCGTEEEPVLEGALLTFSLGGVAHGGGRVDDGFDLTRIECNE